MASADIATVFDYAVPPAFIAPFFDVPNEDIATFLRGGEWWEVYNYPPEIFDQCFGLPVFEIDLADRYKVDDNWVRPRMQTNIVASGKSEVKIDDKEFKVDLNVSQFKPEELKVKVIDYFIVIHGKHGDKADAVGNISREFTRHYMVPKSCDMDSVASSYSKGMLTIIVPKKPIVPTRRQVQEVPIVQETKEAVKESGESE